MHKLFALMVIVMTFVSSGFAEDPIEREGRSISIQSSRPSEPENDIFLPVIFRSMAPPVFGVETYSLDSWKLDAASAANVEWLRKAAFDWDRIEPVRYAPPVYDWTKVDEAGLISASAHNLTVIGTIKFTPSWAQKLPGWICGPIALESMDEFAQFVTALVSRYSAPPYNIRYWEFGNEIDVDPTLYYVPRLEFGCWGDKNDPYYGGRHYAEMLKRAYPAVKAASSSSQVLIGGLLVDCDPAHPPARSKDGCLAAKFLEGILINGGAPYFDILGFHSYVGFGPLDKIHTDDTLRIRDEDDPSFIYRGGQIVGKADYLRSVLAAYGVSKPLFLSEISLSCIDVDPVFVEKFCTTQKDLFWDLQADFVVTSHLRSWGLGMMGTIWYMLEDPGWRDTGLHTPDATPKPGYFALQFMANELKEGIFKAEIKDYPGLRGYTFQLLTKNVSVLWAPDGVTGVTIPLPAGTTAIFDKYGNSVPLTDPIEVVHPTYFEFPLL